MCTAPRPAPRRGGAVIGLQLRYQRMCCTRRRACRRARADAGRCAIAIWTVAVDAVDAAAVLHHHRRRGVIVTETTGVFRCPWRQTVILPQNPFLPQLQIDVRGGIRRSGSTPDAGHTF